MVNLKKIKESRKEIARLLERFDEYEEAYKKEDAKQYTPCLPKQTGAIKRASMDVTRSLAILRDTNG